MFCLRSLKKAITINYVNRVGRVACRSNQRWMSDLRPDSQKLKKLDSNGPLNWRRFAISAGIVTIMFGAGYYYKTQKEAEMEYERRRSLGKAAIGGPFELIDTDGKVRTNKDFLGRWVLVYFGFSHCPDVCPDELEKMVKALDIVKKSSKQIFVQPLFITVDPVRDNPEVLKEYLKEFSEEIIGLTGNEEQIKQASKAYRVYYSAGPKLDDDYIVDHTIIMYLIDPYGEFVDYYGQNKTAEEVASGILLSAAKQKHMKEFSWMQKDIMKANKADK